MAKQKSSLEKQVAKSLKKANPITLIIVVLCLLAGLFGGWFGYRTVTKNDTFEIIGDKIVTINLGESYLENGAKVVAFGKDVSKEVKIEGEVDNLKVGEYAISYTIDNFKFKGIKKIRIVKVVNENE